MTRFDKFWQIGGYFKVVGRIAYKSMGPFFVIFILLCGFVVAFRNRSVYKGTDPSTSSFNTTDHFNKSFEYSFFQIYFMMVGDNNNENMGIYDLTGPNLVTFLIYFVFIFLISSLALNIFTGIAVNEIQELIDDSYNQIMKDKIDYIYDHFEVFETLEKYFFVKFLRTLIKWLVRKMISFSKKCRDWLYECVKMRKSFDNSNVSTGPLSVENDLNQKSDSDQIHFVDDKYVENFETLEYSVKNLEDKLETRIENLEDKLETRIENLENKLDLILKAIQK
jgi:hypothetical protein